MKRLVGVVRGHAQRYRTLLDENWQATDWTRRQAEQVLKRIDSVLEALPAAVRQAHETHHWGAFSGCAFRAVPGVRAVEEAVSKNDPVHSPRT
jgi:hypothetical protein